MVKRVHLFYAASVVLHGGMALAVGTLHVHEPSRPITITIASAPPPRPVAPSLPPPPPKAPEPAPVPKAAPVVHKVAMAPKAPPRAAPPAAPPPPRAAPPPVPSAAPPDFGVALGNGTSWAAPVTFGNSFSATGIHGSGPNDIYVVGADATGMAIYHWY